MKCAVLIWVFLIGPSLSCVHGEGNLRNPFLHMNWGLSSMPSKFRLFFYGPPPITALRRVQNSHQMLNCFRQRWPAFPNSSSVRR